MNDPELIARIAEKLGWEEVYDYEHDTKICCWAADKGKSYSKTELPSTDACLRLLDQNWRIEKHDENHVIDLFSQVGNRIAGSSDKDLPRAILLAILEVE